MLARRARRAAAGTGKAAPNDDAARNAGYKWIVLFLVGSCINGVGRMATHYGAPVTVGLGFAVASLVLIVIAAVALFRGGRYTGPVKLSRDKSAVILGLVLLLATLTGLNLYEGSHH